MGMYIKMAESAGKNLENLEKQTTVTSKKFCKVCSAPAGKHIYYGARTCISCRGFFRRSVQNNHHQFFGCSNADSQDFANQCLIDSKTRKNCKKCRFAKCTSVGMRVSWVLTHEERCQRMLQRSRPKLIPIQKELSTTTVASA